VSRVRLFAVFLAASGCVVPTESTVESGKVLLRKDAVAAGSECPNGGSAVKSGIDTNGNQSLDDPEVTGTVYLCDNTKSSVSGITYVRWGRTVCPEGSSVVYTGYAAGAYYMNTETGSGSGSGSNTLCLTDQPEWDGLSQVLSDLDELGAAIYGTEFATSDYASPALRDLQAYDARCVVCEVPANQVLMIPGTTKCPASWTTQYFGLLMANISLPPATKSEYVCVDLAAERAGSPADVDGNLWSPTETICGALPCPPYAPNREVGCVVCTK
jgi:hypothetical protein